MIYFSHIRAGLISTALLMTTALASPALAETLPEISPRQIASDVEVSYNPQTGAKEYVAPSFDPFEEDRSMAGTASLRSVSSGTTIDGQSVRGGALLDMTFYYNSASNDSYDTRGYEEAVYLSGEYAPVTLRDNRILECNEQVQDVVYYHEDYYRPSLYVNLFRPYRHYRGHYGYGFNRGFRSNRNIRGYRGYRHASCISLNHVICHGIPGDRAFKDGDIANIDVTVIIDGWHGDHSRMYSAGEPKRIASRLMDVTYESLMAGIAAVKPGNRFGDIGAAISEVARKNRFSVVEDFCGHGLGQLFHDEPNVVHSARAGTGPELKQGMFFTIEPMLNVGRKDAAILSDGWTAVTRDRKLSAQFEHSVGVTEDGVEIFTLSPGGLFHPTYKTD